MKMKQLFMMLGMAAMLASCSQDELGGAQGGGAVTITATVDNGISTRASTYDTDDVKIDQCLLEVYGPDGSIVGSQVTGTPGADGTTFTFTVGGLDPDVQYDFIFWADNKEAEAYGGNLKERQLASGADLTQALAFKGVIADATPANATKVTLTHAVAKVTVKTTGAMETGDKVALIIPGVTDTWNVLTDEATGNATKTYDYELTTPIAQPQDAAEVTTFYVPAPVGGTTSDMTLTYANASNSASGSADVTNVPLKADYRTVLKGDVASLFGGATANITASLTDKWKDQGEDIIFPQTNEIVTAGVGQITKEAVEAAAETGDGKVVISGKINETDLSVIAGMTDIKINLDLSNATLMNEDGTQSITEFPAVFKYQGFLPTYGNALTDIVLPDGITSLEIECFRNCVTLKTITFPEGLKEISHFAFCGCNNLTLPDLNGIEEIGPSAFRAIAISDELIVPESVTSAGNGCFASNKMTSVIWNSDCKVPEDAFSHCENLTSITLTTDAELGINIANSSITNPPPTPAFDLTCTSTTPPTITEKTFAHSTIKNIYVPASAVDTYKLASYWADYKDIIKAIQ